MHYHLLLSTLKLLFLTTTIRAYTDCHGPFYFFYNQIPVGPPWEDCLAIYNHIPSPSSLQPTRESADNGEPPIHHLSPSSPFFPQAVFTHGDCLVLITYSDEPLPTINVTASAMMPMIDPAEFAQNQPRPATPLSEASVFKIWEAAKAGMNSVMNECVAHRRAGVDLDFAPVPEDKYAWYMVQVLSVKDNAERWRGIEEQIAALRGTSSRTDEGVGREFDRTSFLVP